MEWNEWIDQREMSFKAKHNPKRNQAQIDSMLFYSISSISHSFSPHSFFLLHLYVKQTIEKTIIHTLFNRFPKHKMNTMHQLREITLLSFLNHFYPSFLHFILTFPRLLHQFRIPTPHNRHKSIALHQLLHAARFILLLPHSTSHHVSISLLQQLEIRFHQRVLRLPFHTREILHRLRAHIGRRQRGLRGELREKSAIQQQRFLLSLHIVAQNALLHQSDSVLLDESLRHGLEVAHDRVDPKETLSLKRFIAARTEIHQDIQRFLTQRKVRNR